MTDVVVSAALARIVIVNVPVAKIVVNYKLKQLDYQYKMRW